MKLRIMGSPDLVRAWAAQLKHISGPGGGSIPTGTGPTFDTTWTWTTVLPPTWCEWWARRWTRQTSRGEYW